MTDVAVCRVCTTGGGCSNDTGCEVTPEFMDLMRLAADALIVVSRVYHGRITGLETCRWTAGELRYEANYLERHT